MDKANARTVRALVKHDEKAKIVRKLVKDVTEPKRKRFN